jgi:oligopeptide transport system substrate-binding protein
MALRWLTVPLLAAALAGCWGSDDGAVDIAFIDTPESLFAGGVRLSSGAQHLRAATNAGLVALDAEGETVPALADRWIVTDDGRSYIFRLRDGTWPDGRDLTAESARTALNEAIGRLRGTSLGLDLAPIAEVRVMAGRVIEIRLSSPVPMLLQLLAQPELALTHGVGGSGDMLLDRDKDHGVLAMKPPAARGIPETKDWTRFVRPIRLSAASGADAIRQFDDGEVDIVLGGRLDSLPLVDTGPLSRGTVRLDPALGLFGLRIRRGRGLLASADGRAAVAEALDRDALIEPFGIGGWVPTTRVVAPGLPGDPGFVAERWADDDIADRRAAAAARIAAWRRANGDKPPRLTLALGRGPGLDILFAELAAQLAKIGVGLERVPEGRAADLVLVDRVARYAEPRWFLDQFNCSLGTGMCSSETDALVREANVQLDPASRATLFAQAEAELLRANVYIPFGSPVRFSLVRGNVDGFVANPWAFHPLPPLAVIPR